MVQNNAWNFDSTAATGAVPYATGTNAYGHLAIGTTGQVLTVSGGIPAWAAATDVPTSFSQVEYWEDFEQFAGANIITCTNTTWQGIVPSLFPVPQLGHPGIISLSNITSNNCMFLGNVNLTVGGSFYLGDGTYNFYVFAQINTLGTVTNNFTATIGFMSTSTAGTFTNGCYFTYNYNVNGGKWQTNCTSASTSTTNDSGITLDTNWHLYQVSVNAAATSVSFYIDGVQTSGSPITTHIPNTGTGNTALGPGVHILKVAGANAGVFLMDYAYFIKNLTSART